VPITVRLTPEQEAAYALDYGLSRADLKPEVQAEYDRLLAERRAGRPGQAAPELPGLISAEPSGFFKIYVRVVTPLAVLAFVAFVVVMAVNTRDNFQTLRADLAPVQFPSGYRLVTVSRSRTNCSGCSLTETWAWFGNGGRTVSAACSDVYHAMTAAYPPQNYGSVEANPRQEMPAGAVCDYYTIKDGPGFTKASIEVIVRPDKTQSDGGVVIQLTATY